MGLQDIATKLFYAKEKLRYLIYKIEHSGKKSDSVINEPFLTPINYRELSKKYAKNKPSKLNQIISEHSDDIEDLTNHLSIVFDVMQHDNESLKRECDETFRKTGEIEKE